MKKQLTLTVLILSLLSGNVMALTLSDARTQGRVGETLNGYLVALKNDAETQTLVEKINEARSASYQQLAETNHIPVIKWRKWQGKNWSTVRSPASMFRASTGNGCKNN